MFDRLDFRGESSRICQPYKRFEATVDRLLGERVRADGAHGADLWAALTNVQWCSHDGHRVAYTCRRAGDLVAWVREEGSGVDWYWCIPPGAVANWIGDALAMEGWSWASLPAE
jgi:hypothetical protein